MDPVNLSYLKSYPPRSRQSWLALADRVRQTTWLQGEESEWLLWLLGKLSKQARRTASDTDCAKPHQVAHIEEVILALLERNPQRSSDFMSHLACSGLRHGALRFFERVWENSQHNPEHVRQLHNELWGRDEYQPPSPPHELGYESRLGATLVRGNHQDALRLLLDRKWLAVEQLDRHDAALWVRHPAMFDLLDGWGLNWNIRTSAGRTPWQLWVDRVDSERHQKGLLQRWASVVPRYPDMPSMADQATEVYRSRLLVAPPALWKTWQAFMPPETEPAAHWVVQQCRQPHVRQCMPMSVSLALGVKSQAMQGYNLDTIDTFTTPEELTRTLAQETGRSVGWVLALEPRLGAWAKNAQEAWPQLPEASWPIDAQWQALQAWCTHRGFTPTYEALVQAAWWKRQCQQHSVPHRARLGTWLSTPDSTTGAYPWESAHPCFHLVDGTWYPSPEQLSQDPSPASQALQKARAARTQILTNFAPTEPGAEFWFAMEMQAKINDAFRDIGPKKIEAPRSYGIIQACLDANLVPHPMVRVAIDKLQAAVREPVDESTRTWCATFERWRLHWDLPAAQPASAPQRRIRL